MCFDIAQTRFSDKFIFGIDKYNEYLHKTQNKPFLIMYTICGFLILGMKFFYPNLKNKIKKIGIISLIVILCLILLGILLNIFIENKKQTYLCIINAHISSYLHLLLLCYICIFVGNSFLDFLFPFIMLSLVILKYFDNINQNTRNKLSIVIVLIFIIAHKLLNILLMYLLFFVIIIGVLSIIIKKYLTKLKINIFQA